MEEFSVRELDGGVPVSLINNDSRKRKKVTTKVKAAKIKRYSAPTGSVLFVPCKHNTKHLRCYQITPRDVKILRDKL